MRTAVITAALLFALVNVHAANEVSRLAGRLHGAGHVLLAGLDQDAVPAGYIGMTGCPSFAWSQSAGNHMTNCVMNVK
jgi:hypothetical protein